MPELELDIVFEDNNLLVVNKPAGVLSQPGKTLDGSIATQVRKAYPKATGSMLVHRLDMETSGLMILAKDKTSHRHLQQQFERRLTRKRYVALLAGQLSGIGGRITLPLRVDIENRPTQIVCQQHGKSAETLWYKADIDAYKESTNETRVFFHPVTGRSHQLRVHAASSQGLGVGIVGDRLYGRAGDRMYLHADQLGFWHPVTERLIQLTCNAPF